MEEGRWKMEDGRWKMEEGRWKKNVWGQAIEIVIVDGLSTADAANEAIVQI
ncbi:hypothetical protein [Okeania sp. SIO2B3]|uniref:hypothetical protein n=1 Tax=Okeania sp. SIO2B3 TaxID=2607784 RepID=UPI0013C21BA6|nr:hypothetical protein [Okeania sp. SIO2B3]NET46224.1 hypothetical protein [Okeania sp. SIO2B3]